MFTSIYVGFLFTGYFIAVLWANAPQTYVPYWGRFLIAGSVWAGMSLFVQTQLSAQTSLHKQTTTWQLENRRLIVALAIFTLIGAVLAAVMFPYPPVFNTMAFNLVENALWIHQSGRFPIFSLFVTAPVAVFTQNYPTSLIQGFWLSFFGLESLDLALRYAVANIFSLLVFVCGVVAAFGFVFAEQRKVWLAAGLFILMFFAMPPFYEVFVRTPGSDMFTVPLALIVLFSAFWGIDKIPLSQWAVIAALAVGYRIYFLPVIGIVTLYLLYLRTRFSLLSLRAELLRRPLLWAMATVVLLLWPLTYFRHYHALWNDFAAILGQPSPDHILAKAFRAATNSSQVIEGSGLAEAIKSFFATSVYYKTFERPELLAAPFAYLSQIFSTPLYFLFVFILAWRGVRQFLPKIKPQFLVVLAWCMGVLVTWILLNKSNFPLIKLIVIGLSAFLLFSLLPFLQTKKQLVTGRISAVVLIFLFMSFAANNLLVPGIEVSQNQSDFQRKYGFKEQFLDKMKSLGVTNSNSLWLVRAEHGGALASMLGGFLWDYKWYDDPRLLEIHSASSGEQLSLALKKFDIRYVIAMPDSGLIRFFKKPFHEKLAYPEELLNQLLGTPTALSLIATEQNFRGLEWRLFEVTP